MACGMSPALVANRLKVYSIEVAACQGQRFTCSYQPGADTLAVAEFLHRVPEDLRSNGRSPFPQRCDKLFATKRVCRRLSECVAAFYVIETLRRRRSR
jgi:hypothetical protein